MAATAGSFDIQRPFTYVFEDPDWIKKVLIGGAVLFGSLLFCGVLIGIPGILLLAGYQRRVALATAEGRELPIPELFTDVGDDIMNGLKMIVINIVWMLPAIILRVLGMVVMFGMAAASNGNDDAMGAAGGFMMLTSCIALPLQLLGAILGLIGILRFWDTGELGAGFRVGEMFAFAKRQALNLLLAFVVMMAAGIVSQFGCILLIIGFFFAAFWSNLASGHALGQVIRIDRSMRGAG